MLIMGQNGVPVFPSPQGPRFAPTNEFGFIVFLNWFQMVRKYSRHTTRQNWSAESMREAVQTVCNGTMGYKKAAQQFKVPQTTLERYVAKAKKDVGFTFKIAQLGSVRNVFTEAQEMEIVKYVKDMESRLFGFTMIELRKFVYQLAVANGVSNRFSEGTQMAGPGWMEHFLRKHPTITLRKPEATSGARAMGFNKVAVNQFFGLLTSIIDKYQLTADKIYNCDETGITVNPKGHSKILALKGKRQVGVLTSAERGETVTIEICCSASGSYFPPCLIFPRKRKRPEFELGLPPGSMVETSDSGWVTGDIFFRWFKKFVQFSGASKENAVLLIFDGHASHTKNLDLINHARENGVVLLCLPPHCSYKLQPLDVGFMKPLSNYYENEVRVWLRSNPGKVVTLWQLSTLFGAAYVNAATMKTAMSAFKKTGIWPPNQNVFEESDFLPASTTDIPLHDENNDNDFTQINHQNEQLPLGNNTHQTPEKAMIYKKNVETTPPSHVPIRNINNNSSPQPQCSWMPDLPPVHQKSPNKDFPEEPKIFPLTSPQDLQPIPNVTSVAKRPQRKRGKTAILTSTSYKIELETSVKEKHVKANSVKRKISSAVKNPKKKASLKLTKKLSKEKNNKDSSSDEDDAICLYCEEFYSTSVEGWISCCLCYKWAHNSCAGINSDDDECVFRCELCA